MFIHCFNLFFTIDIHNSIIAKIKLFVKRDVVMNQTVDLPIRFDREFVVKQVPVFIYNNKYCNYIIDYNVNYYVSLLLIIEI